MNYHTHTHNTRAQLHVHATLFFRVSIICEAGRLLVAGPSRVTH